MINNSTNTGLPGIPEDFFRMLWENTDNIDFIFTKISASMNADAANAKTALQYIQNKPATLIPDCPHIAQMFIQGKGKALAEADVYFNAATNCAYFIFKEKGKARFANEMTNTGVSFFTQMTAVRANPK